MKELHSRILAESAARWFTNPAGLSANELASSLDVSHEDICQAVEELSDAGYGTLNRDVKLVQISFDSKNPGKITQTPITTHIFFPSKQVLKKAYFESDLPQKNLPEYVVRLHLGAHQYGLVYFDEEVLSRYFEHPEIYEINDSLAGGEITINSDVTDERYLHDRYLYVRYGKCRLNSGRIAVTAIYKDLSHMGKAEQRFWHAHEIDTPSLDVDDPNFQTFLSRTYDGAWVSYPDPIGNLLKEVAAVNSILAPNELFARSENVHLRMPVEQTYKSLCESASELYKVVGADALSQKTLKILLQERFGLAQNDLIHKDSGRPLSTNQLLALLESKLLLDGALTSTLKVVQQLRTDAAHKVLKPDVETQSYSTQFASLCEKLTNAIIALRTALST